MNCVSRLTYKESLFVSEIQEQVSKATARVPVKHGISLVLQVYCSIAFCCSVTVVWLYTGAGSQSCNCSISSS